MPVEAPPVSMRTQRGNYTTAMRISISTTQVVFDFTLPVFMIQVLRLNREYIKRSSDFCYLGSVVAVDGTASTDVM